MARRINTSLSATKGGGSVTASTTGEQVNTEKNLEIPVEDPPTFFEIITQSPKEVYPNKGFAIKFKTDAHPNYFNQPETFVAFIEPQSFGVFSGNAKVLDGYGLAYFQTSKEIEIGDKAKITLEIRPPRQKAFIEEIDAIVVENPSNSNDDKEGKNKIPNLDIQFVGKDDLFYEEKNWNEHSVAEVEHSNEEVTIYVSAENKNLSKLIARAQRKNDNAVDNIKNKYLEHISFYAFMLKQNKIEDLDTVDEELIPDDSYEQIQELGLRNASETVCGIINDFFEFIIIESIDEDE